LFVGFTRRLEAAATAVIVVPALPGHPEYSAANSFDIRVELRRAGQEIKYQDLEFNVRVTTVGVLSNNQKVYFGMMPSAFIPLPPSSLDPSLAYVDLPADGQPPKFDDLRQAIDLVLAKDPGGPNADLAHLPPLTPKQSRQVAAEIIWNRTIYPPPEPIPSPDPRPLRTIGQLYTRPPADATIFMDVEAEQTKRENDRKQFVAERRGYLATREAETRRLAGFVFAASAAVACEKLSADANRAGLTFPIITNAAPLTGIPKASVILTEGPVAFPSFIIPAAYYYALGAMLPPQVGVQQRYDMALLETEIRLLSEFQSAIDSEVIDDSSTPVSVPTGPINMHQAARRLHALGSTTGSLPEVQVLGSITDLVEDWLDYDGATSTINTDFWKDEVAVGGQPAAYLELLLHVITRNHQLLMAAIKGPPHNVASVSDLVAITDQEWKDFFLKRFDPAEPSPPGDPPRIPLLPPFTMPGAPGERVEAFIRHLRNLFRVPFDLAGSEKPTIAGPPTFDLSICDVFKQFTSAYKLHSAGGADFAFGKTWDTVAIEQALADFFPGDAEAQAWLKQALETIDALYRMTDIPLQAEELKELRFSLMEALFARGFTDAQGVQALSKADFKEALIGTVAYLHADAIYDEAGATGPPSGPAVGGFEPINPDGLLTDCIPPEHLSPLGPVEYLHELLKASEISTCEMPMPEDAENKIEDLIATRRGRLGDLHATSANLKTPLPKIDLVNESLEALTAGLPGATGGTVYDTAGDELAGHKLRRDNDSQPLSVLSQAPFLHDPATIFAALPEHSSPAAPIKQLAAYDRLKSDFSSPLLPYSQPLDISRSYLKQLGTSRYAVMRRFRKDITEFVLDPAAEPSGFQRHVWRYPVRVEISREYLSISPEEFDLVFTRNIAVVPTIGELLLREMYGFDSDSVDGTSWTQIVAKLSEFLKRIGLTYCEFIDLWHSEFVKFQRSGNDHDFPICEPCCLDRLSIEFLEPSDPTEALKRLAVFVRLWRKLQQVRGARYTFTELRDICEVLHLFTNGSINQDFIRQLPAFQILRDNWTLDLIDKTDSQSGGSGADRTHLLALWVGKSARKWSWAVGHLLDQIQVYAQTRHDCRHRSPELIKLLGENLDPLSNLAGFDSNLPTDTWYSLPTHTLRFVEVLTKLYASDFGVGEILFLFTADPHLAGDDPFPLPDENEALDSPLDLPDDEDEYSLWALRRKLLNVCVSEQDAIAWTWARIENALRNEFGFTAPPGSPDPLNSLGEHFFPCTLESARCQPVDPGKRQYRTDLSSATTSPVMWNTPPEGPFRYDTTAQELWTGLPLNDQAVNEKLSHIRQLKELERKAVQDLYFSPRVDLASFAFIFTSLAEAVKCLIEEPDEGKRWAYFQREFAQFYARCCVIAEHLAGHVQRVTHRENKEGSMLAWYLLCHLFADENLAKTPWETDSGQVPDVTWKPHPNGGAFAALLGLTGTGLLGELTPYNGILAWREVRGPMKAFDHIKNEWNTPVPTILPSMNLTLLPEDERFATLRNGIAIRNINGEILGGAQGFSVNWSGVLLVEKEGSYEFWAGAPTPEREEPDFEIARNRDWRVTLKRGQRTWVLLSHHWEGEHGPAFHSGSLVLKRGAYQLIVEFRQPPPTFSQQEKVCPQQTGFQLKYCGPDTENCVVTVPLDRLFRDLKDGTLSSQIEVSSGAAKQFLELHFTSTLRDIRRTYQRAFKALLFTHRFCLSAKPIPGDVQSEIGYMLEHGDRFLGRSYYRVAGGAGFSIHDAYFNFNFVPLKDPYNSPSPSHDLRVEPTLKRKQALFDWWERVFDYVVMRKETKRALESPAWLLFYRAAEKQPDDPAHLLRHLGIDIRHAPLVLKYYEAYFVASPDLEDERWAIRAWKGEKWIRELLLHFMPETIGQARPDLWVSDDPNSLLTGETQRGNENLTRFFRDGCIENGDPRRYEDIKQLNDGLRWRARTALVAYLCGMNRVPLPWGVGVHAQVPRDLSDLLLQDVEVGLCERASRIEEAANAVQTFVQRARLGLEVGFTVSPAFVKAWDRRFATFHIWEACKRREIYRENWIDWDELQKARKTEAFRFLESELRRSTLTVPLPGGLEWWPDLRPPPHPSLITLQAREPAEIRLLCPGPVPEGLGLMGTPERDARPSWLAPIVRTCDSCNDDGGIEHNNSGDAAGAEGRLIEAVRVPSASEAIKRLPLWLQAAIRLGSRFIRVAAAGVPPASTSFVPRSPTEEVSCCVECGRVHPPVIDEYYFWIQDSRYFDEVSQDADVGSESPDDPDRNATSDWHKPEKLPCLLYWESKPMVHLFWCRVHNGEFNQRRRSDEGLRIAPGSTPELSFKGRTADSLRFEVTDGTPPPICDGPDNLPPGFRYDIPIDSAVVLPTIVALPPIDPSAMGFPGGLLAYPFFAYFKPGAHVEPPTLFSVSLTVAGVLRSHCRFEAALKWYDLFFNPLKQDNTWEQCPKQDSPPPPVIGTDGAPGAVAAASVDTNGEAEGVSPIGRAADPALPVIPETGAVAIEFEGAKDDEPCCPQVPVTDDVARNRAITLHYLETLLQWGDALICRNTPEAFQQATVIYNTLDKVLGPRPIAVFSRDDENHMTIGSFVAHPPPLNPRLLSIYDREADRLALIHHCNNARRLRNGRPNMDMPYWGDSPFRDGWQTTMHVCQDEDDWCMWCCSPYRFVFLVQKALELAGEVRRFGGDLLSAYEKGDAEYLASMRATHERQLLHLALEVRQNQWREADWQLQALRKTKEGTQTRKRYIELLILKGLNSGEIGYEALTGVSMGSRVAGNVSEAIAQGMGLVPDFWTGGAGFAGSPLAFAQIPVGNKLAAGFATAARILNALAEIASTGSSLSLTVGGWDRREDEWHHQVEVIGIEIEQIERQILAAERRRDIALRELNNHQRQIEHSIEVQNFLRDKFTSHELYLFLQQETAAMHYQAYELALHTARQAQQAFNYERGYTARMFLPDDAWDNLHEGLMAGERLQMSIRQMEKAYLDANCREYELTKHISLQLNFPLAFLCLKIVGYCEIEIPEWMFDLDYPGQYMRRIKNVTVTIPCVVGPYTGVHCRLTLLSSMTRVDPRLTDPPAHCCGEDGGKPKDPYSPLPDDHRVVKQYTATEAIATSGGQNDSGMFELDFHDERYLPFEFAGAAKSRWRIELPQENNQFDVDTLSDVILHLNYTAREGGEVLRKVANEVAQQHLPGDGVRIFDIRREFPDTWQLFQKGCSVDGSSGKGSPRQLVLRLGRNMFPFLPGRRSLKINRLMIFFETKGAEPSAHKVVEFIIGKGTMHRYTINEDKCKYEEAQNIYCVTSVEWPGLFHGGLDIQLELNEDDEYHDLGIFRFPPDVSEISQAFLFCGYNVSEDGCKTEVTAA
jgi:hypothetical protein